MITLSRISLYVAMTFLAIALLCVVAAVGVVCVGIAKAFF